MIEYQIEFRNIRNPRIEIRGRMVFLVTPGKLADPDRLIEQRRDWILSRLKHLEKLEQEASRRFDVPFLKKQVEERLKRREELKKELLARIGAYARPFAEKLGVSYKRICIRRQRTKWGSASFRGNLNFNIKLAFVHEDVLKMIVFHEVLHLKIMRHDREFKSILKSEFSQYRDLCRMLKCYSLVLL
jgi:predicted metal-dependent hydrolase